MAAKPPSPPRSPTTKDGKPVPERDHVDAGRRRFFRMFLNPVAAAVNGYELPANHTSKNPPVEKPVIRPGPGNVLVLGLLGPLATGMAVSGGFVFQSAQVSEVEMRYVFARGAERVHVVFARPGERTGHVIGATRTFAVFVEGNVDIEVMDPVARMVLMYASQRDHGQLWTTAANAVAGRPSPDDSSDR